MRTDSCRPRVLSRATTVRAALRAVNASLIFAKLNNRIACRWTFDRLGRNSASNSSNLAGQFLEQGPIEPDAAEEILQREVFVRRMGAAVGGGEAGE